MNKNNNPVLKRIAGWLVLGGLAFWLVTEAGPLVAELGKYAVVSAVVLWLHTKLVPNSEVSLVWRKVRNRKGAKDKKSQDS